MTPDLLGPVRNGGIGTACTFLAEALAGADYRVAVLFTQTGTTATREGGWYSDYAGKGIEVVIADHWRKDHQPTVFPAHPALAMSHAVYEWLAQRHFDAVFFMEWQGHGFYAMQAKQAGLAFSDTTLITQIHSPSLWHSTNNAELSGNPLTALTWFMERKSVEWADIVVSPSQYMLDWVRRHGFNPPAHSVVLPNLIRRPQPAPVDNETSRAARVPVDELVFFGRLEYRKGLVQFCDAIDRLVRQGSFPRQVTFVGKFSLIGDEHSGAYIARRASRWSFPVVIHARFDQAAAMAYLRDPGRFAVMPSVSDNSPYTVYECLVAGVPFAARDTGGVAELIHPADHATALFSDNPADLAIRLADVLQSGARQPRLSFDLEDNRRAWLALVGQVCTQNLVSRASPLPAVDSAPVVSVCLSHYNRPHLLRQAVDSLLEQTFAAFEVVLVDDGSTTEAAQAALVELEPVFASRGWQIVRQPNQYLGKARNTAVRLARGEYVLFMDDDNIARPSMIEKFVKAARSSGAELVTAVFDVFGGNDAPHDSTTIAERYLPVGDIISFSLVTNAVGDANSLIRKQTFERLGGFSEDYGIGHEDFELFLRAALSGSKTCVVPEPLFWYRRNGESMLSSTHAAANRMRSFRPFMDLLPAPLAEMAALAHGSLHAALKAGVVSPADASATDEDVRRLATADPDSETAIVLVAKRMASTGQQGLARQLILDLSADACSPSDSVSSRTPALLRAVDSGSLAAVQSELKMILESRLLRAASGEMCECVLAIVLSSGIPEGVVRLLAAAVARSRPDSVVAQLEAAHAYATACDSTSALSAFRRAAALADAAYLKARPDVANAVSQKQFRNGMAHFHQHGRSEGCAWPELKTFQVIARRMLELECVRLNDDLFGLTRFFMLLE